MHFAENDNYFFRIFAELKTETERPMTQTKHFIGFLVLVTITTLLSACSKNVTDDIESGSSTIGQGSSNLSIVTRAGESEGMVAYPVVLYVFNGSQECVTVKTLADSNAQLTIEGLKADTYTVYAIGGADNTRYALPTQADATATTLITLQEGKVHEDLMTAKNTVVIGENEDNQLTLTMTRMVSMVQRVEVKKIPTDVEAVSLVITPLREAFQLNGEYSGEAGSFTLPLTRQTDDEQTWKNAAPQYMLPSVGNATVSIKMTREGTTRSYSYTCAEPILANYKLNIDATYTGGTFDVTGTMTGATWAGERSITFTFNEESVTGSEETTQDTDPDTPGDDVTPTPEPSTGSAPAVGTAYEGAYVLRHVDNGDNTITVTFMSAGQIRDLNCTYSDPTSVEEAVNEAIVTLSVDGIDGWRLPTIDELDYIGENYKLINNKLNSLGSNFDSIGVTSYFYTYTDENTLTTYCPDTKKSSNSFTGACRVRAFTTMTFNK